MKTKPPCLTIRPWLQANLGKSCLAGLTGTDAKALSAAVQLIELYSYDQHPQLLHAFAVIVRRMQPSMRPLAFHAIAHVMDWSDRVPLWEDAGLGDIVAPLCAYEPRGSARSGKVEVAA